MSELIAEPASLGERWQQRFHPLLQQWVVVSAHRDGRPWRSGSEHAPSTKAPRHDASCYLCPGNARSNGSINPHYDGVFAFENDYPGMSLDAPTDLPRATGVYKNRPATGIAKVLCYTPRHDLTLAELSTRELQNVVAAWQRETRALEAIPGVESVVIFENKGNVCGASSPHAHGQAFATNFVYSNLQRHCAASSEHFATTGRVLFQDIILAEQSDGARVLAANRSAIAFVPYFARYPYEVYIAPLRTCASVAELSDGEAADFSALVGAVLIMFDNLWNTSFPYTMMLHQLPRATACKQFHFHAQFYPPLRKPGLLKYLGGAEVGGGNFHADTLPERKAAELRRGAGAHYKQRERSCALSSEKSVAR